MLTKTFWLIVWVLSIFTVLPAITASTNLNRSTESFYTLLVPTLAMGRAISNAVDLVLLVAFS